MNNIAIFASGSGTNAENIIRFFRMHEKIQVKIVLTNNEKAGVIRRANELNTECLTFSRADLKENGMILSTLKEKQIDFIVLAGFLWLIPSSLVKAYPDAIINIHPALLPKYGGKGMYGSRVHEAVIANKEKKSGISIHFVNEKYDEGNIIFQAKCPIEDGDTPEALAKKVHQLEYRYFPEVIEQVILKKSNRK